MKIQCPCGTKIAFDVTPEMAQNPVRFVCPNCGLDSSDVVNQLVRQELAQTGDIGTISTSSPPPLTPAPQPVRVVPTSESRTAPGQERIHVGDKTHAAASASEPRHCPKHPGQRPTHQCLVCHKPICPKCLEYFGFVCSALCKNKAELQGIELPVYAGQKSVVERSQWRKINRIAGAVGVFILALVAGAFWFHFFASRPSVAYSVKFDQPALSGQSVLVGDQLIFLREGTLERHDIKRKKQVWSQKPANSKDEEVASDSTRDAEAVEEQFAPQQGRNANANSTPSLQKLAAFIRRAQAPDLSLHVSGQNIWVASADKLVRHDWATGSPTQEIPIDNSFGDIVTRGDELWITGGGYGSPQTLTRVNLATGESRTDQTRGVSAQQPQVAATQPPTANANKALDPAKIAAKAPGMSLPQKIALPATLSIQRNQQAALDEIEAQEQDRATGGATVLPRRSSETITILPSPNGSIHFTAILLEHRIVARKAMKDAPAKSALTGDVSVVNTLDVANEILNDIQRQRGGEYVEVDESRYLVTIRRPDVRDAPDWRSEVVGPPMLFPLKTVTVLAAGSTITVFDKLNKKLWQSTLNFPLPERMNTAISDNPAAGLGPCVEHGNTLYVFDEGVLSAFDLVTGNALWRLPSVGISGLFFDDDGNVYVNSTSASPESIKYSRQIDVNSTVKPVVMKIEPKTGKILWTTQPGGVISHLSGKFIYTLESSTPDDEDEVPYAMKTGFETPPFLRVKRINPRNGKVMWEYFQQRGPMDVRFKKNIFLIVFKNELQILKFVSL